MDTKGDISNCNFCKSKFDWTKNCPEVKHNLWLCETKGENKCAAFFEDSVESLFPKHLIWLYLIQVALKLYVEKHGFNIIFNHYRKKNINKLNFFLIWIHSIQSWAATTRHRVTRKRSTKRLQHTKNLLRKNLQLKDVC